MHKSLRHLRSRYGLTPEHYEALVEAQGGRCAGCGQEPVPGGKGNANARLFVDHDHRTDDIRGLLCQPCNAAVGLAYDSPETLRALADYLEREPAIGRDALPPKDRGARMRNRTHCPQGHPYDEANTYVAPSGYRQCRICRGEHDKKRAPARKHERDMAREL